ESGGPCGTLLGSLSCRSANVAGLTRASAFFLALLALAHLITPKIISRPIRAAQEISATRSGLSPAYFLKSNFFVAIGWLPWLGLRGGRHFAGVSSFLSSFFSE